MERVINKFNGKTYWIVNKSSDGQVITLEDVDGKKFKLYNDEFNYSYRKPQIVKRLYR